jgi:trehalose-phosphatase
MSLVGVVTGRSLADARALVPVEGLWYAAAHGMHIAAPDGREDVDPVAVAARPELDTAVTLARTVGWRFEDKGHAVTFHFRHVATPELTARQMRAQMVTVLDPRKVQISDARCALEVRPKGARTKAEAVAMLLDRVGAETGVVVGDDRTDIDAFRGLEASKVRGIRVAVDSPEAPAELLDAADVVLGSQAAVQGFLAQLLSV